MTFLRDTRIDFLKFIGLLGLVTAHVSSNSIMIQIRSFDVNLLVILSAMLASRRQIELSPEPMFKYYKKRFTRLVFPTWIFLTGYFIMRFLVFDEFEIKPMAKSYLLIGGTVNYVWIIYVYLVCAFVAPFAQRFDISKGVKNNLIFCAIFIFYLIIAEISSNVYYRMVVLYPIFYGLLTVLGMNWNRFAKQKKILIIASCLVVYIILAIVICTERGYFVATSTEYKYPPKLYYIAYTVGMAFLIYEIVQKINGKFFENRILSGIVTFYSSCSLWFYLWHIVALGISVRLTDSEILQFVTVMLLTTAIVALQRFIVISLKKRTESAGGKFVLSLFEG